MSLRVPNIRNAMTTTKKNEVYKMDYIIYITHYKSHFCGIVAH